MLLAKLDRSRRSACRGSRSPPSTTSRPSSPTTRTAPSTLTPGGPRRALVGRRGRPRPREAPRRRPLVYHGRGGRAVPRAPRGGAPPAVDLTRDRPPHLLADPGDRGRPSRRGPPPPARRCTGRPPRQRRRDGLGAPHRAVRGRDADLHRASRGIREPDGARGGLEDAARNDRGLPRRAGAATPPGELARAIRDVRAAAQPTADGTRRPCGVRRERAQHCLGDEDAPTVTAALATFGAAADDAAETGETAALTEAAANLRSLAEDQLQAADHLLRGPVANPGAHRRVPAVDRRSRSGPARCVALPTWPSGFAPARPRHRHRALLPFHAELRRRRVRVFGDALDMFLADTTDTHARPGRLLPVEGGELR